MECDGEQSEQNQPANIEEENENAADLEAQIPTERGLMKSEKSVIYSDENKDKID